MDWKLELVTIPVSDVDRAKAFYVEQAGFVADHDHVVNDRCASCSSRRAARPARSRSAPASPTCHPAPPRCSWSSPTSPPPATSCTRAGSSVSEVQTFDWGSFVFFADPDGNRWAVQQLPPRD